MDERTSYFDAEAWIRRAIAAGMDPCAVLQADGSTTLFTREPELTAGAEPPAVPQAEEDRQSVIGALIARSLVVDHRRP